MSTFCKLIYIKEANSLVWVNNKSACSNVLKRTAAFIIHHWWLNYCGFELIGDVSNYIHAEGKGSREKFDSSSYYFADAEAPNLLLISYIFSIDEMENCNVHARVCLQFRC